MKKEGKLVIGNWKMHGDLTHLRAYTESLKSVEKDILAHLVVCPPSPYLMEMADILKDSPVEVGAQGCRPEVAGSYTGDVSAQMLVDTGARYVLIGHSERRAFHGETEEFIKGAVASAHYAGLIAVLCIGEDLAQRGKGLTLKTLETQCQQSLPPSAHSQNTIIAYEPLWAIGTGHAATPEKIKEVHQHLRTFFEPYEDKNGPISLIYGGSVAPENAETILSIPEVDGVLVGKASLAASSFLEIAYVAQQVTQRESQNPKSH